MEQDRLDEFTALIISASRSVTKLKSKYMTEYGLGSTHTMCIRKLYSSPDGLTRTRLATSCELDKAQVSRIIGDLAEKGYVSEGAGSTSYRRKITLSEEGRHIAEDINGKVLLINKFVSKNIPDGDIEAFYRVFGEICKNLKAAEDLSDTEY